MSLIYYIGIGLILLCAISGWRKGFVKMLGQILASILTFLFLFVLRNWVFESMIINFLTGQSVLLARIVVCVGGYLILFFLLKTIFGSLNLLSKAPVIRGLNRILGIAAGTIYGMVLTGIVYMFYTWIFG